MNRSLAIGSPSPNPFNKLYPLIVCSWRPMTVVVDVRDAADTPAGVVVAGHAALAPIAVVAVVAIARAFHRSCRSGVESAGRRAACVASRASPGARARARGVVDGVARGSIASDRDRVAVAVARLEVALARRASRFASRAGWMRRASPHSSSTEPDTASRRIARAGCAGRPRRRFARRARASTRARDASEEEDDERRRRRRRRRRERSCAVCSAVGNEESATSSTRMRCERTNASACCKRTAEARLR